MFIPSIRPGHHVAVDLDRTLAFYIDGDYHRYGPTHIGFPVPTMVNLVREWIRLGIEVVIFTSKICPNPNHPIDEKIILNHIRAWCFLHLGKELPVTNQKTPQTDLIVDDRCIQVMPNTGNLVGV